MEVKVCSECNKEYPSKKKKCPHCKKERIKKKSMSFGILSLIMSIIYLFVAKIPLLNIIFLLFWLLGLISSIISITREKLKILGLISLVITIFTGSIVYNTYNGGDKNIKSAVVNGKKISYNELYELANEKENTFDSKYRDKKIKFTGKVEKVKKPAKRNGNLIETYEIVFSEGWTLEEPKDCSDLSKIKIGDVLKVETRIESFQTGLTLWDYSYEIDSDEEKIDCKTIIKKDGKLINKDVKEINKEKETK